MWRWIALALVAVVIVIFGFSLVSVGGGEQVSARALLGSVNADPAGYTRAIDPYEWNFPADYGPHPDYQTEWWYYTGNLADENGRRFGYQFTIFRRAILPESASSDTDSEWRTDQVYMVHFTVSDIEGDNFYHAQRFSRGSAGLAGAVSEPRYRVWLEDWEIEAQNDNATLTTINAAGTDENVGDFAISLTLEQIKPPALQGDNGLSPKSDEPGNASYYYSLSRLITDGEITVGGQTYTVSGTSWKDHEFGTSALGPDATGWDWFGLHLDDNRELMLGQIRLSEGGREPMFGGLLVDEDGSTRYLSSEDFTITATDQWTSPHSGAIYPAGWDIAIDVDGEALNLTLTPLINDQELQTNPSYWEGAVRIGGDVSGYGYAELTGYVQAMQGYF
ncbi:MAG: carotenoid 1,2-hydratase [Burkholderiales bacterium]|nr:carotenoid 1,2-hydratase [Anaerolineae bacterium]